MRIIFSFFLMLLSMFSVLAVHAECTPTPDRSPGLHYKPVTQFEPNTGKGLRFNGFVRSAVDCKGIVDAKIGHWQANAKGWYDDDHRAYVTSNKLGMYSFNTDWPPAEKNRPPHLYFIVIANGYKTLITRWDSIGVKSPQASMDFVLVPMTQADTSAPANPANPASPVQKNN